MATAVGLLLAVAGIVVALTTSGTVSVIGAGLVGVAAVILLSVDFYLVGRSEDRHRLTHRHG